MKKYYLLLILFTCLILTGCGNVITNKEVKDTDDFQTAGSNNGFTVSDNMNTYQDQAYITNSMIATSNDITIEMVIYDTAESASKVQTSQIDNFNLLKNNSVTEKKVKGENYYKYFLTSNNYYMVTSRVDNTLIFCKTLLPNKEKVDTILDELGY